MSNLSYYFQYDTTTGIIYPQPPSETAPASSSAMGVLGPYPVDTASADIVMAYTYPRRFLAQGSPVALVEPPYFTLAYTESNNEYTITATLNNPPTTPPTDATFTVLGQTFTEAIASNQATFTVALHAAVASATVHVSVSANGCVQGTTTIGVSTSPNVNLQVYTPSGGVPTVAPVGTGSKTYLEAYYALSKGSIERFLADIGTSLNLLFDAVFNVLIPAINPTLTVNQQSALTDIKANLLPNVYTTMENAYPSGGMKQLQYSDMVTDLATTYKNFEAYMNDLQAIPGLA